MSCPVRGRNGKREGQEIRFQCPYPANHEHGDRHPSARYEPQRGLWCCDVCGQGGGWKNLCQLLDVPIVGALKPRVVARYVYCDEDGKTLRRKLRWAPGFRGRTKSFSWEKPTPNGGWTKCRGDGNPRRLYGLEKLAEARTSKALVIVVEGEKDCDAARRLDFIAVCNPEGAAAGNQRPKWQASYSQQLQGLSVAVIADKDKPGRAHAQHVARDLHEVAASVRLLELPGEIRFHPCRLPEALRLYSHLCVLQYPVM